MRIDDPPAVIKREWPSVTLLDATAPVEAIVEAGQQKPALMEGLVLSGPEVLAEGSSGYYTSHVETIVRVLRALSAAAPRIRWRSLLDCYASLSGGQRRAITWSALRLR